MQGGCFGMPDTSLGAGLCVLPQRQTPAVAGRELKYLICESIAWFGAAVRCSSRRSLRGWPVFVGDMGLAGERGGVLELEKAWLLMLRRLV